jgi:hypothetical protein
MKNAKRWLSYTEIYVCFLLHLGRREMDPIPLGPLDRASPSHRTNDPNTMGKVQNTDNIPLSQASAFERVAYLPDD